MATVDPATVAELAGKFTGEIIAPDDSGYEETRRVFNGMFDRRPALIARCAGAADVAAAIQFARAAGRPLAVRGGGHSVPGYSSCDDGIVIDLSLMREIRVDPAARTARAQAGATWGDFDRATQDLGLATTGGRVTTTGIAGLTLGSGSGWLERKYGLVLDNLRSVELVTAGGEVVTANERTNAELFWGLRGGGGNFGVVTSFEYQLHELGPIVYGGMLLHPRDRAAELVPFWRDFMRNAPDEVCGGLVFLTAPPEPFVPEAARGKPAIGVLVLYAGPLEEAEDAFRPLVEFGPPELTMVQPMPYTAVQELIDPANPPGRHNYWKSENVPELSDPAVATLIEHANRIASPFTVIVLEPKRGAIGRVPEDAMALGHRDAECTFYGIAMWEDPTESELHISWARGLAAAMEPYTSIGIALNFSSEVTDDRIRATFGAEKYARLVALKNEWDPENVFCNNQNIRPTG
jgi:FAD/FMN-containing dehydrogenase